MRASLLALLLATLSMSAAGQGTGQVGTLRSDDAEHTVRTALAQFSQGLYTSWAEKDLNRLGDASSVALTKVLRDKDLNAADVDHILAVITMSFAAPKLIQVDSDRQPRTALFVLKYLDSLTVDPKLRKRIADARALLARVATSPTEQRN
jgi:hypothetical protein